MFIVFYMVKIVYICVDDLFHILLSLWYTYSSMESMCIYICIFACILYQSCTLYATTNLSQSISDLVLNHQDFVLIFPFWFV